MDGARAVVCSLNVNEPSDQLPEEDGSWRCMGVVVKSGQACSSHLSPFSCSQSSASAERASADAGPCSASLSCYFCASAKTVLKSGSAAPFTFKNRTQQWQTLCICGRFATQINTCSLTCSHRRAEARCTGAQKVTGACTWYQSQAEIGGSPESS